MGLNSLFRRNNRPRREEDSTYDVMRPWWAWGPIGLIWYAGHHDSTSNIDAGHMNHMGDAGHINHNIDSGGFGGFDGGAGGGGF